MKIVIRAGGVGSRLWPVSREHKPKQFHALTGQKILLHESIDRVKKIAPPKDIYVSINANAENFVRQKSSDLKRENIIIEPQRKDTAAAIGLESIIIANKYPKAIVASLGSDHHIKNEKEFLRILKVAEKVIQRYPNDILAIGVRPLHPDLGYGYIELGKILTTLGGEKVWRVNKFTEKPNKNLAKRFLEKGNYLWNANMFVWRVSAILKLYQKYLPGMWRELMQIKKALGTSQEGEIIKRVFNKLERVAVDYALIEKCPNVVALAADIGWSDIGDWARIKDELAEHEEDNVVLCDDHIGINSKNILVHSRIKGKIIATIGVQNLIIVDTEDALLICDKYHSGEVKKVVQRLKELKKSQI